MNEFAEWLFEWCGKHPEIKIDDNGMMYSYHDGWYAIYDGESVVVG